MKIIAVLGSIGFHSKLMKSILRLPQGFNF